ncbi:MAG: acyl-CoA thioesterase [Bacteroidales bacterium]|nr:acyl-CoA thioesterase [Bacteroidales bacterium]
MKQVLKIEKEVLIRFNEVDSMGIVWHGHYVTYFEDAREEFGRVYDLDYLTIVKHGYYVPLVNIDFSFKSPLTYGDRAIVEITYLPCETAKILFSYRILSVDKKSVIATGSSTQVFLDRSMDLVLYTPDFYLQWQKLHHV